MIAHYPAAAHVHVIANGGLPKNAPIGTTNPANPHRGYILYVGSLSKRKNFPRLAELACRLARERGYRFVFVGDKSKSLATSGVEIPDDVKSLITFAGAVDDPAALFPFYRNAACFVFPSFYESSGLPPIEAMACGCPVIASDIPALRERCGDAAIYCDPHNADSIASALERVMADGDLRTRLRALGHQRAASYNWESCALQTLDVIRRSIDRARA